MSNSAAVPSIDITAKVQVDQEMALEWRRAWWRVVIPATLGVLALVLACLPMPLVLYEAVGTPGADFAVCLSQFGAFATVVVAFRTAQVRPLMLFEKVLVGSAAVWMLCGALFAVLLGVLGGW